MVQLLKIKEHIYRFIGKYEIYAMAVFRFLVAFLAFSLQYASKIKVVP